MRKFAWLTFGTGLALSAVAGFYSVIGLAMIFSGAFVPVIVLASILELSKLVAVSWMYRYRYLAGRWIRLYFYTATIVLMLITSMGIFGYLTRAHVESESTYMTAQLTLDEIRQREGQLKSQIDQINTEIKILNEQSTSIISQLTATQRLTTAQGAVNVQRENANRRNVLFDELRGLNAQLSAVQQERVTTETESNKATADIGPLRYVAQTLYGTDDVETVRQSVVWLTLILISVFDPLAIMLLLAANILFTRNTLDAPSSSVLPPTILSAEEQSFSIASEPNSRNRTDVPEHLLRKFE